jgi:HxlR-like helix-turn-helix
VTRVRECRQAAARLIGEVSLGLLCRRLSASRFVTIAQVEGGVRGAGNEFVLACGMRFAARESAIFGRATGSSHTAHELGPKHVEYALTPAGVDLLPALAQLNAWGQAHA